MTRYTACKQGYLLPARRTLVVAVAVTAALALGLAAAVTQTAQAAPFPPVLPLSDLDGSTGFRLDGNTGFRLDGVAANDVSGNAVSAAGDINGDGIDDLLIVNRVRQVEPARHAASPRPTQARAP